MKIIKTKCINCGEDAVATEEDNAPLCMRCKMARAKTEIPEMAENLFMLLVNLRNKGSVYG